VQLDLGICIGDLQLIHILIRRRLW